MTLGLPSRKVRELAGVPSSTLDYWVRTGLVTPSIRSSQGKRVERWWTTDEAVAVRAIRSLREAGASLQVVRKAVQLIKEWDESLASARLYWDGQDLFVVAGDGGTVSVGSRPGQGVLHLVGLPIAAWMDECAEEAEVVDLERFRELDAARRKERRARSRRSKTVTMADELQDQAESGP